MTKAFERRLDRLEQRYGCADKIFEIPNHDGEPLRMTEAQLRALLREIDGKTRGLPSANRSTPEDG